MHNSLPAAKKLNPPRKRGALFIITVSCVIIVIVGLLSEFISFDEREIPPSHNDPRAKFPVGEPDPRDDEYKQQREERLRKLKLIDELKQKEEAVRLEERQKIISAGGDAAEALKAADEKKKKSTPHSNAIVEAPFAEGEPLLPGQCPNDPDLNDPLVKAIKVPTSNAEYLKMRKGGWGYPDFMFQCRERRFGNYLQWQAEISGDPDNSILDPLGRFLWCPKTFNDAGSLISNPHHATDSLLPPADIIDKLSPLNTPAIPSAIEGVPVTFMPQTEAEKALQQKQIEAASKDRSFETLIPLLKMSLRRKAYLTPLLELQQRSIGAETPATHLMWKEGGKVDEAHLGVSLMLELWHQRFATEKTPEEAQMTKLSHEEWFKRIIVMTTWLVNRPQELHKHILRMIEREGKSVADTVVTDYWHRVQMFQLGSLNITGRYRDETFFNNQAAQKHCQLDSHDDEKGAKDGRKFRVHRLENLLNVRHTTDQAWDHCDHLSVDIFLRFCGLGVTSTQDAESLFLFNVRGALGTRFERKMEVVADLENAKLGPTLVKVLPGASADDDFDPKTIENEDSCVVDGTSIKLGQFGISQAIAIGSEEDVPPINNAADPKKNGNAPVLPYPPTLCRLRHLARAFRKYHRMFLRMGAVAATDRAAAHGLAKLYDEEGSPIPRPRPLGDVDRDTCPRSETIIPEWLLNLKRMDQTLRNIVPEMQMDEVYDADDASLAPDSKSPLRLTTAPLMRRPMTQMWTMPIDDSFVPLWTLTLWEHQQFELMMGPFAAAGLLQLDRRYRKDSLSFNHHPYTVAMKKNTFVNGQLQLTFGGAAHDESAVVGKTQEQKVKSGQSIVGLASNQFIQSPKGKPEYTAKLNTQHNSAFGVDFDQRTALAKISHIRYGFIDLDEIVEATGIAMAIEREQQASSENKNKKFVEPHAFMSQTNAFATIARMLSFYASTPFVLPEEHQATTVPQCASFKKGAPQTGTVDLGAMLQCPFHPIHTEGWADNNFEIFMLHRYPLSTYTLKTDTQISLGKTTVPVAGGGIRVADVGFISGVTRQEAPRGIAIAGDAGKRLPIDIRQSLRFNTFAYVAASASSSSAADAENEKNAVPAANDAEIGLKSHEMPPALAALTDVHGVHTPEFGVIADEQQESHAKHGRPYTVEKSKHESLLRATRDLTWNLGLKLRDISYKRLKHGEPQGIKERWPSYFAFVPLKWDQIYVPDNAVLQLSSAAIYTAGAVIRRPMMWVGSEGSALLARCVASNEPNCGSDFAALKLQREQFISQGFSAPLPSPYAASTLRYVPSSELVTAPMRIGTEKDGVVKASYAVPNPNGLGVSAFPLVSLTEALYQRFPMTIVGDLFWMSMYNGLKYMKESMKKRPNADPELQPPFTSCIGLRDAHPYVQYALSNNYGEATITAVSEDHYGGLTFTQAKGTRPFQSHLSPGFFGLSGDDDSFDGAEVAGRIDTFTRVRKAMRENRNKW